MQFSKLLKPLDSIQEKLLNFEGDSRVEPAMLRAIHEIKSAVLQYTGAPDNYLNIRRKKLSLTSVVDIAHFWGVGSALPEISSGSIIMRRFRFSPGPWGRRMTWTTIIVWEQKVNLCKAFRFIFEDDAVTGLEKCELTTKHNMQVQEI